jgi:hypothetical protein
MQPDRTPHLFCMYTVVMQLESRRVPAGTFCEMPRQLSQQQQQQQQHQQAHTVQTGRVSGPQVGLAPHLKRDATPVVSTFIDSCVPRSSDQAQYQRTLWSKPTRSQACLQESTGRVPPARTSRNGSPACTLLVHVRAPRKLATSLFWATSALFFDLSGVSAAQ